MNVNIPHGAMVIVWKGTDIVAQPPYKPEDVDYGVGVDTDGDGLADYIDWHKPTIKETADKLAAEYAAQYDDGKWREYAEEDFYAGFMAAVEYLKQF